MNIFVVLVLLLIVKIVGIEYVEDVIGGLWMGLKVMQGIN
jgi:hypothetical protein